MLNSSSEGDVLHKITKIEENNKEVKPEEAIGESNHGFRPSPFHLSYVQIKGKSTANELYCFVGPGGYNPAFDWLEECGNAPTSTIFLKASNIFLDYQVIGESVSDALVVTLKNRKCKYYMIIWM